MTYQVPMVLEVETESDANAAAVALMLSSYVQEKSAALASGVVRLMIDGPVTKCGG